MFGCHTVKYKLTSPKSFQAICINQTDNAKKNQQVQMMQLIYRHAQGLIIWMNSPGMTGDRRHIDANITKGLKAFARAHRAGRDTKWLARLLEDPYSRTEFVDVSPEGLFRSTGNVDSAEPGGFWFNLVKFFDQEWWRRVWVRQEIAMSQSASAFFGESIIDWEDVAAVSHWVKLFTTDLDEKIRDMGGKNRSGAYSGEDLQDFRQTLQRKGDLDFQRMLIHARTCEATDPRDKVFAILGMVTDHGAMPVDYNLTPAEVAKLAFRRLAILNRGLDALIFSQNPGCKEKNSVMGSKSIFWLQCAAISSCRSTFILIQSRWEIRSAFVYVFLRWYDAIDAPHRLRLHQRALAAVPCRHGCESMA